MKKKRRPRPYKSAFDTQVPRIVTACGRTKDAVEYVFEYIENHKSEVTNDFLALLNDSMKSDVVKGMRHRGFAIFKNPKFPRLEKRMFVQRTRPETQPLWLAVSGLCPKWSTTSKSLLEIKSFADSITDSTAIAQKMGIDLNQILFDKKKREVTLSEGMVAIASIQMALIDILAFMNVKVDGIIGHSIGEIVCGYADGCMTREQTLWTSYYIAKQLMTVTVRNGHTGLEWDEIGLHTDKVKQLYASISEILGSRVFTGKPKKRSGKWISTSIWDDQPLELDMSNIDGMYFARAFTSKVNFRNQLYLIPKNAVVVEISPQPILETVLRRGLGPDVTILNMMKINNNPSADSESFSLQHLLSSLGAIYVA